MWRAGGTWKIIAEDAYAWVCCTLCALCQEARTLKYNNVVDGRWLGPAVSLNGMDLASAMEKAQAAQASAAEAANAGTASSARLAALSAAAGPRGGGGVEAAGDAAEGGMLSNDSDDD